MPPKPYLFQEGPQKNASLDPIKKCRCADFPILTSARGDEIVGVACIAITKPDMALQFQSAARLTNKFGPARPPPKFVFYIQFLCIS